MRTAQDIADDLSFFLNNTYILLRMYYCCKIECEAAVLKIRSKAEVVSHKQTVMSRVAGDIQSSSWWNSGRRRLVLKPLCDVESLALYLSNHFL